MLRSTPAAHKYHTCSGLESTQSQSQSRSSCRLSARERAWVDRDALTAWPTDRRACESDVSESSDWIDQHWAECVRRAYVRSRWASRPASLNQWVIRRSAVVFAAAVCCMCSRWSQSIKIMRWAAVCIDAASPCSPKRRQRGLTCCHVPTPPPSRCGGRSAQPYSAPPSVVLRRPAPPRCSPSRLQRRASCPPRWPSRTTCCTRRRRGRRLRLPSPTAPPCPSSP